MIRELITGHWKFDQEFDITAWCGFVYEITNTINGRKYIGKKQFLSNGKDTCWKTYTGSSKHLNSSIRRYGKEHFEFQGLTLCETQQGLHYTEIRYQIEADILNAKLPDGSPAFYNKMIGHYRVPLRYEQNKESEKLIIYRAFRDRLLEYKTEEQPISAMINWIENNMPFKTTNRSGPNNPMFGRKGEDNPNFGRKMSAELRKKMSESRKGKFTGEKNPRYGKSPFEYFTPEQLDEHKLKLSKTMSGQANPMYGKPCHYRMTDEEKKQWKAKISATSKGRLKSELTKERMRQPKGPQNVVACPHCKKQGGISNMMRYHFDKCKSK